MTTQFFSKVITPASSYDLTDLATVKAALGITGTNEDVSLAKFITDASGDIASYCNRVFIKETIKDTWRVLFVRGLQKSRLDEIVLSRRPVVSIASVVMDGTTLAEDTDYEVDYDEGVLYRLDSGNAVRWFFGRLDVQDDAGYVLADVPAPVSKACIDLVKLSRSGSTRDPLVKQESVPGVGETQYWVGGVPGSVGNIPPQIQNALDPFRSVSV